MSARTIRRIPPRSGNGGLNDRSRSLVGRATEIERLASAFAHSRAGEGRLVILSGNAGIGKTCLADEIAGRARGEGAEVLVGRSYEGDGAPAFWVWLQVLRSFIQTRDASSLAATLRDGAVDLANVVPEIRERLPELAEPPSVPPESARFRFFEAVASGLSCAARDRPIVLVLEDLHAADRPSLLLLEFVARRINQAAILIVGTLRPAAPDQPLTRTLTELARLGGFERLDLAGLDQAEVGELIASLTGRPAPAALAAAVCADTEGNPLFVRETVRALIQEGRLHRGETSAEGGVGTQRGRRDGPTPLSASVAASTRPLPTERAVLLSARMAIRRHLDALSTDARKLLLLAALFGRDFRVSVLARASGLEIARALELIEQAQAARLVDELPSEPDRYRFVHAFFGEALTSELPASRRRALHRQAAEALAADPLADASLAEIAHHYFAAGPAGDPANAVLYARLAGERAVATLAYESATALFRMGIEAWSWLPDGDEHDRAELLLSLAEAHKRAGEGMEARTAAERAATIGRGLDSAPVLTRAALVLMPYVDFPDPAEAVAPELALLEEAIRAWGERDDRLHARALARLALALFFGNEDRRRSLVERGVAMARRVDDPTALVYALLASVLPRWYEASLDERRNVCNEIVEVAERSGDLELLAYGRGWQWGYLLECGDVLGADRALATVRALARELREPRWDWRVLLMQGTRATMDGRFDEAERAIDAAAEVGRSSLGAIAPMFEMVQRLVLRIAQGRGGEVVAPWRAIDATLAARGWPFLGWLASTLEDGVEARRAIDRFAAGDFARLRGEDPTWRVTAVLLAEACGFVREKKWAATLLDRLAPLDGQCLVWSGGAWFGPVARQLALLERALGRYDDAERHFEAALETIDRMGALPHAAHTELEYAVLLLDRARPGDIERARSLLTRARAKAEALGIPSLLERLSRSEERTTILTVSDGAPPATQGASERADVRHADPASNMFRREGEYWTIAYNGSVVRMRDNKGLHYLAHMIGHPGREYHVTDLSRLNGDDHAFSSANDVTEPVLPTGQREEQVDGLERGLGPELDGRASTEYRQRLAELRNELEHATGERDLGRAARARHEMEALTEALTRAYGLGGRARPVGDPGERMRKAVTNQIRRAIGKLEALHPELGLHLRSMVHTGFLCSYKPDRSVAWDL